MATINMLRLSNKMGSGEYHIQQKKSSYSCLPLSDQSHLAVNAFGAYTKSSRLICLAAQRFEFTSRIEPSTPYVPLKHHSRGQGKIKERLKNGEQLIGAFSLTFSPVVAEILGHVGYDYVVVDLEHGPGDIMSALPVLQALASTNTPAIIRLPENNPVWAKKALDIGPAGIMFPKVDNIEDAKKAVRACRYPPAGIRGAATPFIRATHYGLDSTSYLSQCEDDLLIMCQIESETAIRNIKEIASVDGVDCLQTGPRDLRSDMGLLRAPHNKRPTELLREVEKAIKSTGVYLGGFTTSDDSSNKLLEFGYNMVIGAYDIALVRDGALKNIEAAKKNNIMVPPLQKSRLSYQMDMEKTLK